jgi:pimeloyl-ACP methyl ester carboxylesterase
MSKFRLADGTSLRLARWGDPAALVTVVFVHGYALDHRSWWRLAPLLPEAVEVGVSVLAYDHRGHGGSDRVASADATMARLGDDLAELLERAVPAGRVVLVGHDMGGLAVMSLTQRHPALFAERVAGLVLLSTSAGGIATEASAAWPNALGRLVRDLDSLLGSKIAGLVHEHTSKAVSAGLRWWLFGDDPDPADVELTVQMIRGNWPHTVALFRPALNAYAREAALLLAANTPLTAIVGERDRLIPAEDVELLAGAVENGTALVVPGAGHVLPLEAAPQILPRLAAMVHAIHRAEG